MKRRKYLSGLAAIGPVIKTEVNTTEDGEKLGQVVFSTVDLSYNIELENTTLETIQIDILPQFYLRKGEIRLIKSSGPVVDKIRNHRAIAQFNGIKSFSSGSLQNNKTGILPIDSGNLGQTKKGVKLKEPIRLPDVGLDEIEENTIRVSVFNQAKRIGPKDEAQVVGNSKSAKLKQRGSSSSLVAEIEPILTVHNYGELTSKMPIKEES